MTANKAHRQTLAYIVVYLHHQLFRQGQLYVAISRVGSPQKVNILVYSDNEQKHDKVYVDNIVYKEVLS